MIGTAQIRHVTGRIVERISGHGLISIMGIVPRTVDDIIIHGQGPGVNHRMRV